MNGFVGADVEQLDALALAFERRATTIAQTVAQASQALLAAEWTGADIDRVRSEWARQARPALLRVSSTMSGIALQLRKDAAQQRETSKAPSPRVAPSTSNQNGDGATTETTSTGTHVRVVTHPDSKTTTTDDALSGIHGTSHGKAGLDHGKLAADGSLHGEAGIRATETNEHLLGGGMTFSDSGDSFAGAEGDLDGKASLGPDGGSLKVGAQAFAGSELDVSARLSGDYGSVGIGAGVMAGIGVKANAHLEVGWDNISIGGQLGVSLGIGAQVKPSIQFSPKQLAHDLFGINL
ncbi:MAG: hypothetical protein ABI435_00420 [Pseudolysinimonas sp.]